MKVLIISHNVFSKTSNMGKTLRSYFGDWDSENLAQLYVHSEIPTDDRCINYYRITDKEMIKSIISRKSGTIFTKNDIDKERTVARTDEGTTAKLYQKGRRRTPLIYFARNTWWRLGAWKTKKLLRWVDDFAPDIVFLASGDYSFIYRIALTLAEYKKIPLVVSCMDDYYFYNKNENKFLGRLAHRCFMKQVKKTMAYASCIFPICEKMSNDYATLFQKPCYTLHTPATIAKPLNFEKTNAISYIGNLGYKRNEQLVQLGRALKKIDAPDKPSHIDVYSMEKREEILKDLNEENGILFHGGISAERVLEIMGKSLAVIHTESFDDCTRKSVAYSVSTKIADALASGTCILAYGPAEVASIAYLRDHNAAYCITDHANVESGLQELLTNEEQRKQIISNALTLANQNHDATRNCEMIRGVMEKVIRSRGIT